MSKINIEGVVRHMSGKSTVYHPIIEAIMNSIEAIEEKGNHDDGLISVTFKRDENQQKLMESAGKNHFLNVEIFDNGIGLNKNNLDAFDTLYTDDKVAKGGKGFGRFSYIEYFDKVIVKSTYEDKNEQKSIEFNFGKKRDIVENPKYDKDIAQETGTTILLNRLLGDKRFDKELKTVARNILERMLVYFVSSDKMPKIVLKEEGCEEIVLNDLFNNSDEIFLDEEEKFLLKNENRKESFQVKMFKVFFTNSQKSRMVFTAHNREVDTANFSDYVTEFDDDFYEESESAKGNKLVKKNYIIKAYVLGKYLNDNVNMERSGFKFNKEKDMLHPFSQKEIEEKVAEIVKNTYSDDLKSRREKKKQKVSEYLDKHPWYKHYEEKIGLDKLPMNPSDDDMEDVFHNARYLEEKDGREKINDVLKNFDGDVEKKIEEAFEKIDTAKQSELAHYVTLRKIYLDVFTRALGIGEDKKHEKENTLHNIIFPAKKDSEQVHFRDHNLWILDERLNFVEYLRSDQDFVEKCKDRADLIVFNKKVTFRGSDVPSNPVSIFEFKRPGEDSFANPSSKEDSHDQIIRYVEKIKSGEIKSPQNRPIQISDNTPFYGYIIADYSEKVKIWLERREFKQLPNGHRWVKWHSAYNLHIEYVTWDQLLTDAEERNNIFFHRLGLD